MYQFNLILFLYSIKQFISENVLISQLRILRDEEMKGMAPLCSEYVLAGVFIDSSSIDYKEKIRRFHDRIINKNFSLLIRKEVRI